jgi:hypothetical protein
MKPRQFVRPKQLVRVQSPRRIPRDLVQAEKEAIARAAEQKAAHDRRLQDMENETDLRRACSTREGLIDTGLITPKKER